MRVSNALATREGSVIQHVILLKMFPNMFQRSKNRYGFEMIKFENEVVLRCRLFLWRAVGAVATYLHEGIPVSFLRIIASISGFNARSRLKIHKGGFKRVCEDCVKIPAYASVPRS